MEFLLCHTQNAINGKCILGAENRLTLIVQNAQQLLHRAKNAENSDFFTKKVVRQAEMSR